MKLSDYVETHAKILQEDVKIEALTSSPGIVGDEIEEALKISDDKWRALKLSDNQLYLFRNGHYLCLTETIYEMNQLYLVKGYNESGYDKLSAEELIAYSSVRDILSELFSQAMSAKLDPKETAASIFDREIFYT